MKTLVITPTFNEAQNIEPLTREIFKHLPETDILIIDDNSPDGTGTIADRLARESGGRISVMHRPGKMGLGSAYKAGFKFALQKDYRAVFEMDADFSHDPSYLPEFLKKIDDHSLVLGSRYIEGGGVENWTLSRKFISKGGTFYSKLILGIPFNDLTGGFKCFRRDALEALDLDAVSSEGYSFQIEMTYKVHRKGLAITEVPIVFRERRQGKSKMSWKIFFEAMYLVWKIRFSA
jgi:dolichol-phosphate mannosyltransferase